MGDRFEEVAVHAKERRRFSPLSKKARANAPERSSRGGRAGAGEGWQGTSVSGLFLFCCRQGRRATVGASTIIGATWLKFPMMRSSWSIIWYTRTWSRAARPPGAFQGAPFSSSLPLTKAMIGFICCWLCVLMPPAEKHNQQS